MILVNPKPVLRAFYESARPIALRSWDVTDWARIPPWDRFAAQHDDYITARGRSKRAFKMLWRVYSNALDDAVEAVASRFHLVVGILPLDEPRYSLKPGRGYTWTDVAEVMMELLNRVEGVPPYASLDAVYGAYGVLSVPCRERASRFVQKLIHHIFTVQATYEAGQPSAYSLFYDSIDRSYGR